MQVSTSLETLRLLWVKYSRRHGTDPAAPLGKSLNTEKNMGLKTQIRIEETLKKMEKRNGSSRK
jgi:hypothetical protein